MIIRELGLVPYETTLAAMRDFTDHREDTPDELWCLQHPSVFTLGQAARLEHILDPGDIPVIQSCRGGQVSYHGPGQLIIYCLLDLKKRSLGVKALVYRLEQAVLECLDLLGIAGGHRQAAAPGVYIDGKKIASLGLRIRRGSSYHGLSLNVAMDLEPFNRINPCGIAGLKMCQIEDFLDSVSLETVQALLLTCLLGVLDAQPST